mgnify:CR=1 FL=1
MKILMAPVNISGMPLTLVKGLRNIGVDARLLQFARGQAHKFGYDSDIVIQFGKEPAAVTRLDALAKSFDEGYDLYHFWLRTMVFGPRFTGMMGLDLPFIKLRKKSIVYRFTGMDLRDRVIDLKENPFSPFRYGYEGITEDEDKIRRLYIDYLSCYVDQFLVQDPELQQYMPNAKIIERAIDLDIWKNVGISENGRPLIVHGPSNKEIKGTSFVLKACEELRDEGLIFDLKLVHGVSHAEAVSWYKKADAIIDQLHIGAYGVLAVEAMALGKPVLCYIRDDLYSKRYGEMPIINCNPLNIKEKIRYVIKDYEFRKEFSVKGRAFVEKYHDVNVVAPRLKEIYENTMRNHKSVNTSNVDLRFIGMQYGGLESDIMKLRVSLRKKEAQNALLIKKYNDSMENYALFKGSVRSKIRESYLKGLSANPRKARGLLSLNQYNLIFRKLVGFFMRNKD